MGGANRVSRRWYSRMKATDMRKLICVTGGAGYVGVEVRESPYACSRAL